MDFDQYQQAASKTATFDPNKQTEALTYLALGIAGESGEVVEKIKKVLRNDAGVLSQKKREEIIKELGDVLWYLSQMARILDVPFSEVAKTNIAKLADRQARGVIASEGDDR